MNLELNLPLLLETQLHDITSKAFKAAINELQQNNTKEWMSLKEGASYAGVAINTFNKFRLDGLKVCEIDGVKRVSKTEIDSFLNNHSF
ncbi:DNA-binding protein [Sporosarcina sp. YIM B06819]|uniref:DNA-binding protein n=1 Tax=Sporosarcina sp. YIM B06819 TaxID=3081769 RepID=UPI00298BFAA3|nr:DNA-binding protein [Sporosarcina sp. YIM B06819]